MVKRVLSFDCSGATQHDTRLRARGSRIRCYGGQPGMPPTPVTPNPGMANWKRTEVLGMLQICAAEAYGQQCEIVVGMDFAFSFPFAAKGNTFPCGAIARDMFWANVAGLVWPNPQGIAAGYIVPNAAHFHWQAGNNGAYVAGAFFDPGAYRVTEEAAQQQGGHPCCVFNLVGSNQVGKGSLCGIAMIHHLLDHCRANKLPLTIWPFFQMDATGNVAAIPAARPWQFTPHCLTLVETYPGFHWMQTGQPGAAFDNAATWNAVAQHFGGIAAPVPLCRDSADALIAWYAMAGQTAPGAPPHVQTWLAGPSEQYLAAPANTISQEGWIYGV